jgi:hypothetical protein
MTNTAIKPPTTTMMIGTTIAITGTPFSDFTFEFDSDFAFRI